MTREVVTPYVAATMRTFWQLDYRHSLVRGCCQC
jgi:hypothetical protein